MSDRALTLRQLQAEVDEWATRNFGDRFPYRSLMGATEEVGELSEAVVLLLVSSKLGRLAHAQLKMEQGIRGTKEEHIANAKDAVGDIIVYLADYCSCSGFDLQDIIEETWGKVKQRDWKKNAETGGDLDAEAVCSHPWHRNPALLTPCPECGEGKDETE